MNDENDRKTESIDEKFDYLLELDDDDVDGGGNDGDGDLNHRFIQTQSTGRVSAQAKQSTSIFCDNQTSDHHDCSDETDIKKFNVIDSTNANDFFDERIESNLLNHRKKSLEGDHQEEDGYIDDDLNEHDDERQCFLAQNSIEFVPKSLVDLHRNRNHRHQRLSSPTSALKFDDRNCSNQCSSSSSPSLITSSSTTSSKDYMKIFFSQTNNRFKRFRLNRKRRRSRTRTRSDSKDRFFLGKFLQSNSKLFQSIKIDSFTVAPTGVSLFLILLLLNDLNHLSSKTPSSQVFPLFIVFFSLNFFKTDHR